MRLIAQKIGAVSAAIGGVRVVTDGDAWARDGLGGEMPREFHGLDVVSWREVDENPGHEVTRVYFLANNDKHVFVHKMLAQQSAASEGRVVAVLHDPSMFMVHRHMERFDGAFSFSDLIEAGRSQLGRASERLMVARINEWLPQAFDFGVHCMGPTLRKCDELWAHSLYGANRVRFENDFSGARCRTVRICAHPTADVLGNDHQHRKNGDDFNIGVFGWVTPPKRVDSVLRALALALDRMDAVTRSRVRLRIVGRRPPKSDYDPEKLVSQLSIGSAVEFIDYPSTELFEQLIARSDLIFNLRYPSCGESSGTLASAEHLGVRIVASRYQAFREAVGVWRFISVAQPYEIWEAADAIVEAVSDVSRGRRGALAPPSSGVAPIEKLLLNEILRGKVGLQ